MNCTFKWILIHFVYQRGQGKLSQTIKIVSFLPTPPNAEMLNLFFSLNERNLRQKGLGKNVLWRYYSSDLQDSMFPRGRKTDIVCR